MNPPSLKRCVASTFVRWIVAFQIALIALSFWWVGWPLLRNASNDFAGLIALSAQTWVELPANRREALRVALQAEHQLQLVETADPLTPRTSYLPFIYLLQQKLSALTRHPVSVGWDERHQRYAAEIQQEFANHRRIVADQRGEHAYVERR